MSKVHKEITMKKAFLTTMLGATLAITPMFAQQEAATHTQEISVQGYGSFVKNTTQNGLQQSATNTGGVLASYWFFFNRNSGVEANYGFQANTERYATQGSVAGVNSRSSEVSAAYVFRVPMKNVTPFVLAGAGGMIFDPNNLAGVDTQARAAFVYGAGADLNVSKHVFMRAEYRGFVYNSPTWDVPGLQGADRVTHRAEPSVGFGYRF